MNTLIGRVAENGKVEVVHAIKDRDATLIPLLLDRLVTEFDISDEVARTELKKASEVKAPSAVELTQMGSRADVLAMAA